MQQSKNILILSITTMGACLLQTMSPAEVMAQAAPAGRYKINDSRQPRYTPAAALNSLTPDATMSPKNVPDFTSSGVTASGVSGVMHRLRSAPLWSRDGNWCGFCLHVYSYQTRNSCA
ncbi:MAG: hypothetical protein R3D26_08710 [Cyanobacteriota/Melainabacteria group bacterium]